MTASTQITATFAFFKIIVRDMDAALEFYGRALGLKLARTTDQPTMTSKLLFSPGMENGPFVVLYRYKDGRPLNLGNGCGPAGFYVADVDAAYAHVLECGGKPSVDPFNTEGVRVAHVLDPEGHDIELVGKEKS